MDRQVLFRAIVEVYRRIIIREGLYEKVGVYISIIAYLLIHKGLSALFAPIIVMKIKEKK